MTDTTAPAVPTAPTTWDLFTAQHTRTALAAYATADPLSTQHGPHYFSSEADLRTFVAEQLDKNDRQSVHLWDLNRTTGEWAARQSIEPLDIEPTAPADQLALLRAEAARKGVTIKEHTPRTGTYYTMRDAAGGARISRYADLLAVEDALINWVDAPDSNAGR